MAKLAGKNFKLKVAITSGGTYTQALGGADGTMNLSATNLDTSEFGDTFMERLQGLKDASWDFKGFYNAADTTGQGVIQNAFLTDGPLFVQFLPNGTAGFQQQVVVSKYAVGAPVNGVCSLDLTFEGTGPITLI